MDNNSDSGGIVILIIFVCCVLSCIVGLLVWANGGPESLGLTREQVEAGIAGVEFTRATPPNVDLGEVYTMGSYSYSRIQNAATVEPSNLGSLISGKSQDQCDSLCHTTTGCYGYTIDGDVCQLKNNVTLIKFQPGASNLYASRGVGGVLYEHFPYKKINLGEPQVGTFTGSFADAVSNCHVKPNECKGFVWDGSKSDMYAAITAVDGNITNANTYTLRESLPTFILFAGQSYSDSPDDTQRTNPAWAQEQPFNPASDADYFVTWQNGWDAGTDAYGDASRTANTITVQNLAQCSLTPCKGFTPAREGTNDGSKNTYVKKQPPLGQFCGGACKSDPECRVATYQPSTGDCKIYRKIPSGKNSNDPSSNTVWMVDYFPG